eukprot:COSAG06_NODE_19510_length_835_cov_0.773098_1_plen_59_part_10
MLEDYRTAVGRIPTLMFRAIISMKSAAVTSANYQHVAATPEQPAVIAGGSQPLVRQSTL